MKLNRESVVEVKREDLCVYELCRLVLHQVLDMTKDKKRNYKDNNRREQKDKVNKIV